MRNWIILQLLVLILSSCGYKPLYKLNKKLLEHRINIVVLTQQNTIDESLERDKQILEGFLKAKLNVPGAKPSSLKLTLEVTRSIYGMGIQKDLTTTRNAINYNVSFRFYDKFGEINRGDISKSSSFNIGKSPYASISARESSARNVLKLIANEISLIISSAPRDRKAIYP